MICNIYTPTSEVRGILDSPCLSVRLSVCLSVRLFVHLSVCPLTFRVRPVASTVQNGFFPYLVQMVNSMRGCVSCDDPWPWPISSRSFGLNLENHVHSVASTVLDGFFIYLVQMIAIIRGCVGLYVFSESGNLNYWHFKKKILPWPWKKSTVLDGFFPCLAQMITSMRGCVAYGLGLENSVHSIASSVLDGFFPYMVLMITSIRRCVACDDLWPWPISSRSLNLDFVYCVCSVMFSVLDRLFPYLIQIIATIRGCRVLFWLGIWYVSLLWVIMGLRGYSQNAGVLVVLIHD